MVFTSERSKIQTAVKCTVFLLLSLFIVQCSNNYVDEIDRSGVYQYQPGFPEVTFSTAGLIDEDTDSTKINVSVEVLYRSLIFKNEDSLFEASLLLEVQLFDQVNRADIINSFQFPLTINLESQEKINDGSRYIFNRF